MARLRRTENPVYQEAFMGRKGKRTVHLCVAKYWIEVLMFRDEKMVLHKTFEPRERLRAYNFAYDLLNSDS